MTWAHFRYSYDKHCRPLLTCGPQTRLFPQGSRLTSRCPLWYKSYEDKFAIYASKKDIIELKDEVSLISENDQFIGNINNTNQDEALSALEVLGYSRKQTSRVIEMLLNDSPELTVEELIKGALKKM